MYRDRWEIALSGFVTIYVEVFDYGPSRSISRRSITISGYSGRGKAFARFVPSGIKSHKRGNIIAQIAFLYIFHFYAISVSILILMLININIIWITASFVLARSSLRGNEVREYPYSCCVDRNIPERLAGSSVCRSSYSHPRLHPASGFAFLTYRNLISQSEAIDAISRAGWIRSLPSADRRSVIRRRSSSVFITTLCSFLSCFSDTQGESNETRIQVANERAHQLLK